ncbi:UDP-N-acetylmuramoyl-L-alanyl-D-glutamate--2,6-diaminopimelate ligase [[Clostridium] symbiosum]|uniref:UDP-N-acetylmuramoyl-L-alanyl-D-glutamate--2, 6-diaminopimelate ligase n=1 Tax=Clostridium symbiosum TaxID=1512 RepID=UPI001D074982|nr:UDP-N-acetylmuramoyl-L-alanyl-D-glutamate--2,6-diaminopimelate ligase [[Clostridium] symbiosum]MCB6607394.1 UDP-N-acetylmuramoyl-L-alanyl-D-glutamate--2,6-diaminopimelate ligase [[Clostridium] symbiosum]MCB6930050.1 UDP-N-acetylmuramoyl-L-alanyl-D-glutamate--2,6-diaminopimelate ligase [[Clostridium] symbiosum]
MKLREWLSEMKYELLQGKLDEEVNEVVYDSRKAVEHSVFICMRGANVDSHKFIPDVIAKGTRVLVTEEAVEVPSDITVLKVENGRNALSLLSAARFGYPARKMTTIGVTGTKGKTTSTYMIKAILEAAGEKTGLIGTNGAIIGEEHYQTMNTTPESYLLQQYFAKMVEQGCRYMVMEVSSQSYLMHRVDGIFFDYSIFLNISNDHIGPNEHASFEEYLYYKKQLLQNSRLCLVNRDDGHYSDIIEGSKAEIKTFSMEHDADFRAGDVKYIREDNFVGLDFKMTGEYNIELRVNVPGLFNVYNAMAAAGVCSYLGLPADKVAHAMEHMQVDGRMEIVYKSAKCTVIVDYAHNAVSMESLLRTLRDYNPRRLVVVFGCGGNRAKDRRYSMGEIGGKLADLSIITADNSRFEKVEDILTDIKTGLARTTGKFIEIPDRREAIEYSLSHAEDGDIIAIIGKGHENYQEIEGVRHPFLDRTVVEEAVKKLGMLE